MKAQNPGSFGTRRRGHATMRIPQIPMEWMDPMSWRLPSGKALAEFALQAGFLAPLMLSGPAKKKSKPVEYAGGGGSGEDDRGGAGKFRHLSGNKMTAQVWIAILVGLAAAADDLARRRIANWIPAAALAGGFGWQIGQNGMWTGWLHALGGAAVGFGVFLIFYLLGGMGGGDVKLMAGFGALLGLPGVLWAALWTAGVRRDDRARCGGVAGCGAKLPRRAATHQP